MSQRPTYFCKEKHINFLVASGKDKKDSLQYWITNHFKINGVYWDLTGILSENLMSTAPHSAVSTRRS